MSARDDAIAAMVAEQQNWLGETVLFEETLGHLADAIPVDLFEETFGHLLDVIPADVLARLAIERGGLVRSTVGLGLYRFPEAADRWTSDGHVDPNGEPNPGLKGTDD